MIQRTLVLIKPDGVKRNLIGDIINRFEKRGLKVLKLEMLTPPEDLVAEHYQLNNRDYILGLGHVDTTGWTEEQKEEKYQKSYKIVEDLQKFLISGPIVKMVLEGEEAVSLVREITGKTDPATSPEGSIRGDLGEDSFEKSNQENRAVYNLIHASGTPEEAEREIQLWFKNFK
ncbi:MAG: nucleoside-diphosphate kinase [Candidatus Daviesbacteria bacterium]|nr:nucleoside-diphosphate kinase [Candidatus Daviesbacteria bacterium]